MPVEITDARTLAMIHQSYAMTFLTEGVCPLSLDPGATAALQELQSGHAKEIVVSLATDARFMRDLFEGLHSLQLELTPAEPLPGTRQQVETLPRHYLDTT